MKIINLTKKCLLNQMKTELPVLFFCYVDDENQCENEIYSIQFKMKLKLMNLNYFLI